MRLGHRPVAGQVELASASANVVRACSASLVMSTSTGPGRPVPAMWNAEAIAVGDVGGLGDQEAVLGDRHGDAADVGLLEGVGADGGAADLAGDGDDRHRVHVRVGDRGDQVGRAGTGGRHADADLAGHHRVALGRVAGALLVPDEDVAHLLGVVERVVRGQDRPARDAEDGVSADLLERPDQRLGAGQLFGGCRCRTCPCLLADPVPPMDPWWMLRLCYGGALGQEKTPAAGWQTRERVG